LGLCLIPILAKWVLIGRWKPRTIQVWTLTYLRFWCVKTLTRTNPLVLFAGSPIYTLYLLPPRLARKPAARPTNQQNRHVQQQQQQQQATVTTQE
jgi:hypothetical protein